MSYGAHKKLVLGFLGFYFVAGMYVVDQYPFFNWGLFTKIPNEQQDFSIEIHTFDGRVYEPALLFSESKFLFDAIGQSPTEYTQTISELGAAIDRADTAVIAARRTVLEKIFRG